MIGLVIVTHGRLAAEALSALEHVMGPQEAIRTVCVGPEDDLQSRRLEVCDCIDDVDRGAGVIMVTDMFGGTPSNLCIAQMGRPDVEVLGGMNLPLLVKLAKVRATLPLADAVAIAETAGRKYICSASDAIPHCRARAAESAGTSAGFTLKPAV